MEKAGKRIGLQIVTAAALLAAVIAAAVLLLHSPPVKTRIVQHAQEYAHRNFGAGLEIGRLDYNLFQGAITLEGLTLGDEASNRALLRAGRASIEVDLGSILSGPVLIRSARIDGLDLHIFVDREGRTNLPQFGQGGAGTGDFLIRNMEVSNGTITVEDLRQNVALHLPSVQIRVEGERPGLHDILLHADRSGSIGYQGRQIEISRLRLEFELSRETAKIERLDLVAAGSRVEGSGQIRNFSNPVVDVRLETDLDLSRAAALAGLGMQGRARGTVKLTGPIESLLIAGDLQGDVR